MARVSPFIQQIEVFVSDLTDPKARSARLAQFAEDGIREIREQNRAAPGSDSPYEVTVDGRRGAPLASVKPDGVIVAEFDLVQEVLEWIGEQLLFESPVLTGRYQRSHRLFADNAEVTPGIIPEASEYAFVNLQPYARKIERGLSHQAPEGVYEAIAVTAQKRFGNVARVRFSFRTLPGEGDKENRQPAIIVRPY